MTEAETKLDIDEPGFLYGGVAYETLRTYDMKLFAPKYHYERLLNTLSYLGLELPLDYPTFRRILEEGVQKLGKEASIRVIVVPRGRFSAFEYSPEHGELIVYMRELKVEPLGYVKIKVSNVRKIDPLSTPADLKVAGRTDILLAKRSKGDAYDVIMIGNRGQVCEGTFTNVFLVKKDRLITPSVESGILPGITRLNTLRLCRTLGMTVEERWVELAELYGADEVFLTHTSRGIVPVNEIDEWKRYETRIGQFLASRFEEFIKTVKENWE
ncbi:MULTISPECIES: aminotransferase class IV [Pseudothermotoga]|uniref:aminotransferase class IV n=1 Tax=Pseudothermotoga TaxID=1643951 RepID=UPI0009DFB9B9|nr:MULTISPECIES: aminotransferase class IV [Pseudothermotoga]MBC7122875.1 aminotransferase class IV [Pseudothermotoga sp.]MDI6863564.1 aminotransferase class IV [Pseudothermotoga sp.]